MCYIQTMNFVQREDFFSRLLVDLNWMNTSISMFLEKGGGDKIVS